MTDSRDAQSNATDDGQLSLDLIAAVAGVAEVPVFAYLGLLLFSDIPFGAAVGVLIGFGTYLLLPAFVADDDERSDATATPVAIGDRLRQFHRTAAGLALPPAGILLLTRRLVSDTSLVTLIAVPVITAVIYVSFVVVLPQRLS
jgi:hypothetical protein